MANQYEVECPMPECTESLHLEYDTGSTFTPEDLSDPPTHPIGPGDSECQWWKVACGAGHVILVPGALGCPCEDPEGPDCSCDQDAYDYAEENRVFRPHDMVRLVAVVEHLRTVK